MKSQKESKMEEHLKDIKHLLVAVIALLIIITLCQSCLLLEATRPSRAEAKSESIQKVNLVKIGGNYVFLNDIIGSR